MIFFQINSARNCLKLAQNVFRVLTCSFHWCRTSWWHNSCYRRRLYCPCYPPSHRKGTGVDLADDLCLRTPGEVPLRRSRPWPGAGTCPSRWFVLCYSRSPREGAVQSTRKHSDVTWAPGRLKSPTDWLFVFVQQLVKVHSPASLDLFEGNPPVIGGLPSQRASDAESISIWCECHQRSVVPKLAPWQLLPFTVLLDPPPPPPTQGGSHYLGGSPLCSPPCVVNLPLRLIPCTVMLVMQNYCWNFGCQNKLLNELVNCHAHSSQLPIWGSQLIPSHNFQVKTDLFAREVYQVSTLPFHDAFIKWKYFPRYWTFVWGIHQSPVNSPHKDERIGALMLYLICAWTNGWVNNRNACDLRRHRTHYDVTVMSSVWVW